MRSLLADARYALRRLGRSPGFTAIAVLTLALGIGANSAVYSVIRGVLLAPFPYEEPGRVVVLWSNWVGWEKTWLSEPELIDYRAEVRSFEAVAGFANAEVSLTGDGEPERVPAIATTANLFSLLGVEPILGRSFTVDEDAPGNDGVAVLSWPLWQRRFGGDASVVGRSITVNGEPRVVLGVLPRGFRVPQHYATQRPAELFVPLALQVDDAGDRGSHYLLGIARLAPGVTAERANTELTLLTDRWTEEGLYRESMQFTARAYSLDDEVLGDIRPALLVLLAAVGFVLLIACANVANLLLARADGRRREIAVRAALGAGRRRILGQLLVESGLLAVAGGAVGILFASLGLEALLAADPASVPRSDAVRLDGAVVAFTVGVAVLTGLLFGLFPALQLSRPDLTGSLREGARAGTGRARQRFRRGLVVAEVALSLVLVIGAGLMIRTFQELRSIELGLRAEGVLTARLSAPASDYPETEQVVAFYRNLLERVRGLPGVEHAAAVRQLPLASTIGDWGIDVEGNPEPRGVNYNADWQVVTPGYVEAMGLRVVEGRALDASAATADGMPVAMVNRTMAEAYWPDGAVGGRFRRGSGGAWYTVVGVLEDVRRKAVVEEPKNEMYFPHAHFALGPGSVPRSLTLVVRTSRDPLALAGPLREQVRALDPDMPVAEVRTMEDVVGTATAQPRFTMLLLAVFGAVALALAAVGVYGVLAQAVAARTQEIGVRMALGAERARVVREVVVGGLALAGAGIVLGMGGAAFLTRLMSGILYEVRPLDPLTFALVPAILALVALAASWIPARRASRVHPVEALRQE